MRAFADIGWRLAVVLETSDQSARIGLQPAREPGGAVVRDRQIGIIPVEGAKWAKPSSAEESAAAAQVLTPGDVIYVEPLGAGKEGQYKLHQIPEVSGGMVVMDPLTGRVLALVGGFSFDQSQFDRATQAMRQPGSVVQAVRLFGRARQRLHAVDASWSTPRSRSTRAPASASGVRRTTRPASITGRRRCASASSSRAT